MHRRPGVRGAGRADADHECADDAVDRAGVGHGHGGSPADPDDLVHAGGQHRSAADRGSSGDSAATGWTWRCWRRAIDRTAPIPNTPTARNRFDMQLNIDGQQVTNNGRAGAANPRVTSDAIGEFQFVASRWDASQGRSNGVLVNAVTKSGTNIAAGTFSGIFRSDRFNAPDFIEDRVLPYSNKRFNGTFGGPIAPGSRRTTSASTSAKASRRRSPSTASTPRSTSTRRETSRNGTAARASIFRWGGRST